MMRVLICDDEVNVCRLLISLINWDALDLELVGLAHTGPEALQKIQDLLPQIVITDVRIPVFDGLELVSRTQALGIHANFIVVSGYQHFEYVHNALRHGIVDYLLKPINREELNNALEVIISRHQKDLYENNRTRNLERSLQQAQKSLVTRYLNDIIGGRAQDLTTENLELYGLDWHRDRYGCFALRRHRALRRLCQRDHRIRRFKDGVPNPAALLRRHQSAPAPNPRQQHLLSL